MPIKNLDPDNLGLNEDWEGNNVAFSCPLCKKIFIVNTTRMHKEGPRGEQGYRKCPKCGKSLGHITGPGRKSGGSASIEWEEEN